MPAAGACKARALGPTAPTEASVAEQEVPSPCAMVIFGASGDLTRRKLIPALYRLESAGLLADEFTITGFARRRMEPDEFRARMRDAVAAASGGGPGGTEGAGRL